jgi:hypothetical protein
MTPGYCAFVQKFIDSRVAGKFAHTGKRYKHSSFSLGLSDGWVEHPNLRRPSATSFGSPGAPSSHHAAPRKKTGAAKFFKNLWDMCKTTHDVAHQALVMSQDTKVRLNEFFASKNYAFPPPGPELNPVPMVNYVMPPLDDEMFHGYSMPFPQARSRPSWTRTFVDDEIHEDEDEGEDEGEEEEDVEEAESPPPPFV